MWIIEKDVFSENLESLTAVLDDRGIDHYEATYVPFEGALEFNGKRPPDQPSFLYGSIQLCRSAQGRKSPLSVYPTMFCNFHRFRCVEYYPRFGEHLTQRDYVMLPLGELDRRKGFLMDTLGDNGCLFIRPDDGEKSFCGQVVSEDTWTRDMNTLRLYDAFPETLCLVARPQNIKKEWRLVIAEENDQQSVIAHSQYKHNDQLTILEETPEEVLTFAQSLLNCGYEPDPMWTMDIAETKNGLSLLEVGSLSAAGWYDCDLGAIVDNVERIKHEN